MSNQKIHSSGSTASVISQLESKIRNYRKWYYQGQPKISDSEFDLLEEKLRKLDPTNPVLEMVGSLEHFTEKIPHQKKMLSLMKTYKQEELLRFVGEEEVVSTFKIDGVSCSLIYEEGQLFLAKTRGDGSYGENITQHIKWVDSVPATIDEKSRIEIRGELYCDESHFVELAQEMERRGLERPSSQRNIVAGLMGRKDNIDLSSYLQFRAFDYIEQEEKHTFIYEIEHFKKLQQLGFLLPEYQLHKDPSTIKDWLNEVELFMGEGDYQIDGAVFSYNRLSLHDQLGHTAHHPRYKMAFKFEGVQKETTIKEIEWSVSRNGVLTPVALVEPVELSGAMIGRVTLHNYGLVHHFHLKKGDRIQIIRSGEVIPKFLAVIESSENPFLIPKKCPSCQSRVEVKEIRLFCSNEFCPERQRDTILNYIQKMGIFDLSFKRLEEMMNKGLVKDIPSLYDLTKEQLLTLDKVKEKLAQKLVANIEKSKKISIKLFFASLGISGGAYSKCEKVINGGFDSFEKWKRLTLDDLLKIESFADRSAQLFLDSWKEKIPLAEQLIKKGVVLEVEKREINPKINGKRFCITGALSEKRSVVEEKIVRGGGILLSSVSKNTDYLVTNETDSSSSKWVRAKQLGVVIMSESDLKKLLD